MNSSKTDLSDVGLCSLNVHETNYNMLLCHLLTKDYDKCLEKVNQIIGQAPGKYQRHFFLLRGLIYENTGRVDKAQKDYIKYEKAEPKNFNSFLKEGKDLVFEPFPVKQRLCSKFEHVKLAGLHSTTFHYGIKQPRLLIKPSFSMPFIKPPNMIPNIDEESIQGEFTLKQIDAPMPEAPWIRRVQLDPNNTSQQQSINAIKFTDNILMREEDDEDYGQEGDSEGRGSDIDVSQIKDGYSHEIQMPDEQIQKPNKKKQGQQAHAADHSPYLQSIEINPY